MTSKILVIVGRRDEAAWFHEVLLRIGARVSWATNGRDGVAAARSDQPSMIICDTELPFGDGYWVRNQLMTSPTLARVPFVFVSSDQRQESQLAAFRAGAADYLVKPISGDTLLARTAHALECERKRSAAAALSGDLSLIPAATLLQCLAINHRTGILHLASASASGCFSFERGEVVGARCGSLQGEDAALALAGLSDGTFGFERTAEIGAEPILNVTRLLLDSAWIHDELDRATVAPKVTDWVRVVDVSHVDAESRSLLEPLGAEPIAIVELARRFGMGTLRCCACVSKWVAAGALNMVHATPVRVVVGARAA